MLQCVAMCVAVDIGTMLNQVTIRVAVCCNAGCSVCCSKYGCRVE